MTRRARSRTTVVRGLVAVLGLAAVVAACGGGDDPSSSGADGAQSSSGEERAGDSDAGLDTAITTPLDEGDQPQAGGRLRYGVGAETSGWDPTRDRWATAGTQVAKAFFETLAVYDAGYQPVPYLAESIAPDDDFTEWTIVPRDGITFHDGSPFDAAAIEANLEAHLSSPLTSPALGPVDDVGIAEIDGTEAVVVRMTAPWAHFPHILTGQGGNMAAPAMLDDPDGKRHPIGTGPFVFDEWIPDDHLTVVRNDDYWQDGLPYLDGIEFVPLGDNDARLATFDGGDLDITATAVPSQILDLRERAEAGEIRLWLDRTSESLENFTLLNPDEPPFDDRRAREAVAYATDKQGLIDTVHAGLFEPANGLFAPGSSWYTEVDTIGYDPERARALVEEYEADVGPLEFAFAGTSNVEDVEIRQALAAQWAEVGIDARLENLDAATSIVQVLTGQYQAANFALFTAPHPDSDWHFLHSSTQAPPGEIGLNVVGIESGELDAALDTARASAEADIVREQYETVNRVLAEEVPMVFLWHSVTGLVAQPEVRGVTTFTLPGGGQGRGLIGVFHPLAEIWLAGS
jgi:ABC-type transport system substrate-binding protein